MPSTRRRTLQSERAPALAACGRGQEGTELIELTADLKGY
jgi:hypothetical protein